MKLLVQLSYGKNRCYDLRVINETVHGQQPQRYITRWQCWDNPTQTSPEPPSPCSPWRCVLLIPREKNPGGILQVRVTSECCPRSCYTQAGSPGQADSLLLMTGLFTAILTFDKSTSGALLAAGKLYGGPDLPECEEKSKYGHLKMNGGSCQLHDLGWFKEKCNENVLAPTSCFSCCQEQPPQP
ncbi:hypothetical protein AV530_003480 [Patagioenas fasciata monilis]|uniref:Uncharacterized protein n=1 Tax=Patagioenas fasciata monilis TaxID=372326 RepID=A0A1V4K2M6_PATFA|nr:hypothetical protein AV530_003480 [Patagioenas fasciata monilis]